MTFDAFKDFRLDGHKVIITGGAQNIGAGIAKMFSAAGADVLIADLKGDLARATAQAIEKETEHKCRGIGCDVTKEDDIKATVALALKEFGGITTLVNNVGWGAVNPDPLAVSEEDLIASYKLNTISAYRMSAACVPHMLGFHNAAIVNSGSFSSAIPASEIIAYSTAKAALNHLMACLANALAKKVRVNSVLIGTVLTEGYASAGIDEETQRKMENPDTLTGRPGRPQDVANAMLWLASPAGSWVSGQTINVQGGGHVLRLFGH